MVTDGLWCDGCGKRFGASTALEDVNVSVAPGEVVGLVGPNGAGKTTLLHSIVGLCRLDAGGVLVDGEPAWSRSAKQKIAFMPDDLPRPRHLTAREVINLTLALYGMRVPHGVVDRLAEDLDLGGRLDELMVGFSHGMARKVDLMCALVVNPKVLVLDEPFSGMDPVVVERVCELVAAGRELGRATLLSTHDLELAGRVVDRVVIMRKGRVVLDDAVEGLTTSGGHSGVRDAFWKLAGGRRGDVDA